MPLFDTTDGLILTQEGTSVRARAGTLNYLFRDSTSERIAETYGASVAFVRGYFQPRWQSYTKTTLEEDAFEDLTQEIALHWMHYYIVNGLAVRLTISDVRHPQTNRIVRKHASKQLGDDSSDAISFASHFLSMSQADFKKWMEGDDYFASIW